MKKNNTFKNIKLLVEQLFILILILSASAIKAQLSPAKLFTNGMVLQREMEIPVWGIAGINDTVYIILNGQEASSLTDETGSARPSG